MNCYFTELLLYWTVTLLNCYFTELLLYWTATLLNYYFTEFLAFLKVRNSEVSHPNFLWWYNKLFNFQKIQELRYNYKFKYAIITYKISKHMTSSYDFMFNQILHDFSTFRNMSPMPLARRFAPKRLGLFQQPGGLGGRTTWKFCCFFPILKNICFGSARVANKGLGGDVLLKIIHVILVVTSLQPGFGNRCPKYVFSLLWPLYPGILYFLENPSTAKKTFQFSNYWRSFRLFGHISKHLIPVESLIFPAQKKCNPKKFKAWPLAKWASV